MEDKKKKEIKYQGRIPDEMLKKLEEKHGKIYTVEVPMNDDGTEVAVGYFKYIDRQLMGAALSIKNPMESKEMVLNETFLDGHKEILTDDELFFSASMMVDQMMTFRRASLKKNWTT